MATTSSHMAPMKALDRLGGSPLTRLLLMLVMLAGLVGYAPARNSETPKAQPQLLALAAQRPEQQVSVIVQRLAGATELEQHVAGLGGMVTRDLRIINAFVAQLPARALPALATAPGVRWVSLDAPLQSSNDQGPVKDAPVKEPASVEEPASTSEKGGYTESATAAATTSKTFETWATDIDGSNNATLSATFNSTTIRAGSYIWFSAVGTVGGLVSTKASAINLDKGLISFTANGKPYKLKVPAAIVTFDPAAASATTAFDRTNNTWSTKVKTGTTGNVFLAGFGWKVPRDMPGSLAVTWAMRMTTDTPGVKVTWKWAAAVYSGFDNSLASLGIKPVDNSVDSVYKNNDLAGTPESYKPYVVAGARGTGGTNYVGTYNTTQAPSPASVFNNLGAIIKSLHGPDGTYGSASKNAVTFTGISGYKTVGHAITRVEVILHAYVPSRLVSTDDMTITPYCGTTAGTARLVDNTMFDTRIGVAAAGAVYVDITGSRAWKWSDLDGCLKLKIDQSRFQASSYVNYDAVGLRVTSAPGTDTSGGAPVASSSDASTTNSTVVQNVYNRVVRATDVWNQAPGYVQGSGVTVGVLDSGVMGATANLSGRLVANVNFNSSYSNSLDKYGHGTFDADIIAGDGSPSNGAYIGMAPKANIANVRVSDDQGMSTESDVVAGLQWMNDNRARLNIKVVNISMNSSMAQSYHTSPLCAAVEILWFNGITVVVSAGNNGTASLFPPANDPFVITVGATDDKNTDSLADDAVAAFSAYGTDEVGRVKPDLVAPGRNIIAYLPENSKLSISVNYPQNRIDTNYFRMSGTSMAAPIVAGAVALLLQDEPALTPDQVKHRLTATANKGWAGYNAGTAGAGLLDVYAAVNGTTTATANTELQASRLLWTGSEPVTWGSVNWNSVNWNSVNWNSVNWNSVNWNSVNWNSDYFGP